MAFKLNKTDATTVDGLVAVLNDAGEVLLAAVTAYNEKMAELMEPLQDALQAYNEAASDARTTIDEHIYDWRGELEDKSEKWQESDRGADASSFISGWEEFSQSIEDVEIEASAPIEFDTYDFMETLPSAMMETA